MNENYYWNQLVKIFQITEKVTNHEDEQQLSASAKQILRVLKETYDDGYRCGNLKSLDINLKYRSN